MRIDIHNHYDGNDLKEMLSKINCILKNLSEIMATQKEVAQELVDLKAQVDKVTTEIRADFQKLADAIAASGNSTSEVDAALAALKTSVQGADDLNPDA